MEQKSISDSDLFITHGLCSHATKSLQVALYIRFGFCMHPMIQREKPILNLFSILFVENNA